MRDRPAPHMSAPDRRLVTVSDLDEGLTGRRSDIRVSIDDTRNCSIFEIEGAVTADDIIAAMDRHYARTPPPNTLWDFSHATVHNLSAADYRRISLAAKRHAVKRPGGRTAFVAARRFEMIALKLLEAMADAVAMPLTVQLCADREKAIAWLAGRRDDAPAGGRPSAA